MAYDWWPRFLAEAGPAESPRLNPYEQRYAMLALRGNTAAMRGPDAPLSDARIKDAVADEDRATRALGENADTDFGRTLESRGDELRAAAPSSFWDRFKKSELDEKFEEARRSAVNAFNQHVGSIRQAVRTRVRARLLQGLHRSSDKVLDTFRDIDLRGPRMAQALVNNAENYRRVGALMEKLPDGRVVEHFSEANQYTIDEEALLGPTRERLWHWYYEDQIAPLLRGPQQIRAVQEGLTEALKPQFNAQGKEIPRDGERVIEDIVFAIRERAESKLNDTIRGPDENSGLLLEDAMALEALYMYLRSRPNRRDRRAALKEYHTDSDSVTPSSLWEHPLVGSHVQAYVGEKIARAGSHKARIFGDINPENLKEVPYAEKTLVGAHEAYRGDGKLAEALRRVTGASSDDFAPDWKDAKRIVFYHYIVGVPLYAFPRVVGELQLAYRKHQESPHKAWYLHCDRNFEELPDLDPREILKKLMAKRQLFLPPLFASGLLDFDEDGGVLFVQPGTDQVRTLASTLAGALTALSSMEQDKPELYRQTFAPRFEELERPFSRKKLDDALREVLTAYEETLSGHLVRLESADSEDLPPELVGNLRDLLEATRTLLTFKRPTRLFGGPPKK